MNDKLRNIAIIAHVKKNLGSDDKRTIVNRSIRDRGLIR
jgi:predicted membrane GTPase involved in stress response